MKKLMVKYPGCHIFKNIMYLYTSGTEASKYVELSSLMVDDIVLYHSQFLRTSEALKQQAGYQ